MVHSWSTRSQLTTTLSSEHNNLSCPRFPIDLRAAVVSSGQLWDQRGLENPRPFTRSKGSNPFASATASHQGCLNSGRAMVLSCCDRLGCLLREKGTRQAQ